MNKFYIILFSLFLLIVSFLEIEDIYSNRVFITSILIQLISVLHIFLGRDPYSLKKMFYIFSLFFFGIAPLLQFYSGEGIYSFRPLTESEFFFTNIIILIILSLYGFLYNIFYKKDISNKIVNRINIKYSIGKISNTKICLLLLLSLLSFFITFYSNGFNWVSMFFRGGELSENVIESTTVDMIIERFISPITVICFIYYFRSFNRNQIITGLLLLIALLTCFPLRLARFAFAALYIPIFLSIFRILTRRNVFSLGVISGLLIIFPFLENFRHYSIDSKVTLGFDFKMFLSGHFDSYNNFALFLTENMITFGKQLLGVVFFWVPRILWTNKPEGSGVLLAKMYNMSHTNISANFFAEGFVNFGYFGILLFVIVIAYITARIDKNYWHVTSLNDDNILNISYFMILGMFFFMLRGDLLSSFAFTVGILFSIFTVYLLMKLKMK